MLAEQQRHKWPRGWFAVARGEQVTDQKPLALHFLERHFVAWRDKKKHPIVMDGITHQGSYLEHGSLEGDHLRCAVHGYLYDPQGRCIKAPFEKSIPQEARRTIWQSQEIDGILIIVLLFLPSG